MSVCLGLGAVLGGVEEAAAPSYRLCRKLHDLMLEWEGRSLPALKGLSNSRAAYVREVSRYQIPSSTLPAQHCQPASLGVSPLRLLLPSANQQWSHSTHCVPGLCQVPCVGGRPCGMGCLDPARKELLMLRGDRLNSKH